MTDPDAITTTLRMLVRLLDADIEAALAGRPCDDVPPMQRLIKERGILAAALVELAPDRH